jgi:hypothetical protein
LHRCAWVIDQRFSVNLKKARITRKDMRHIRVSELRIHILH